MKILIKEVPLKHFLQLFKGEEKIILIELGDTSHPSKGFIDETALGSIQKVEQLIAYNLSFGGLVYFEAVIDNIKIIYNSGHYSLFGQKKSIEKIIHKIRGLNALPGFLPKYIYEEINF